MYCVIIKLRNCQSAHWNLKKNKAKPEFEIFEKRGEQLLNIEVSGHFQEMYKLFVAWGAFIELLPLGCWCRGIDEGRHERSVSRWQSWGIIFVAFAGFPMHEPA